VDVSITKSGIEKLAAKLDELGEVLTEQERALLLAVFRLAGAALNDALVESESESGGSRPSVTKPITALASGFTKAFQPAIAKGFTELRMKADGVEVGGSVKWSK